LTDPHAVPADDPRLLGLRRIVGVMDRLRDPDGGCPWDRAQDRGTLRSFLIEEAYELLEALDANDSAGVREELGDVLFQVVFHARIAQEEGSYHVGDVAEGIATKLISRHPHVFREGEALESPDAVVVAWEEHKRREGRRSIMDGLPSALPALLRAQRVQGKAARVGFDWKDLEGPLDKLDEELSELRAEVEAGDVERIGAELGDLLFSVVNVARHLEVEAEEVLRAATGRFERRFRRVEATGGDLKALDLEALERLWEAAKEAERVGHSEPRA